MVMFRGYDCVMMMIIIIIIIMGHGFGPKCLARFFHSHTFGSFASVNGNHHQLKFRQFYA